eukprot:gene11869-15886_t
MSLVLWVVGNFLWMTTELCDVVPSSGIHLGPPVPIGGISPNKIKAMILIKTIMFCIGIMLQIMMYSVVYCKLIPMPEEDDEDVITRNEALLLFCGNKHSNNYTKTNANYDLDTISEIGDDTFNDSSLIITLAVIENAYIVFWIGKDLFWALGTGDLVTINMHEIVIFYESAAMSFGTLAIVIYVVVAYLYRRNLIRFLDSITVILWILANYTWMVGEFFIRYQNLDYDDKTEKDDATTRIIAAFLFCSGITVQVCILCYSGWRRLKGINHNDQNPLLHNRQVELSMKGIINRPSKYNIMVTFSPYRKSLKMIPSDDEEGTILF